MVPSSIAPTPPYKALIFNCDGTLADMPVHFQTWSASLKAVGADIYKHFTAYSSWRIITLQLASLGIESQKVF